MALKDISRDCSDSMRPYAGQVIDAIHRSTVSGCLNPGECVRLMYPLGKMLSLLHPPQILPQLEPIIFPHLQVRSFVRAADDASLNVFIELIFYFFRVLYSKNGGRPDRYYYSWLSFLFLYYINIILLLKLFVGSAIFSWYEFPSYYCSF
jgi:hypothetical protein